MNEIIFDEKSQYSFKEVLLPVSQTLFYFTEHEVKEADAPVKGAVIFLRSCDIHALKRLDDMYLHNGPEDYYYRRLRDRIKLSKGTTFHTLRRKQKSRKHNMRCLFPLFFCLNIYILYLFALKMHTLNT